MQVVRRRLLSALSSTPKDASKLPSLADASLLDARDVLDFPPSPNFLGGRVVVRNHVSIFDDLPPPPKSAPAPSASSEAPSTSPRVTLSSAEIRDLYSTILMSRNVKQQTPKGKIARKQFLVCVGNGNGLVGYGLAKDADARLALVKARNQAIQNMDWVERFEERTIWTEMSTKLGATRIILRPRPVGFGLRCNPFIHRILRATGFKDISAKVWGSRNKLNVIQAVFRMLHAGHAPTAMGDGIGGKGVKLSKGVGMRGKDELERARGRKLISLRK
jgi:small subunit ribosomal protein S5